MLNGSSRWRCPNEQVSNHDACRMGKTNSLQILTILPGNVDSVKNTGGHDRDCDSTLCLDMKVVLAYKAQGAALQFLTAYPADPWHKGLSPANGARKILPISGKGVGKKFLWERSYGAIDGTDPRNR
jgi:hypothetical protein